MIGLEGGEGGGAMMCGVSFCFVLFVCWRVGRPGQAVC